jgi:hypothetical protein
MQLFYRNHFLHCHYTFIENTETFFYIVSFLFLLLTPLLLTLKNIILKVFFRLAHLSNFKSDVSVDVSEEDESKHGHESWTAQKHPI